MASSSCFCKRNVEELSFSWCFLYTELLDCVVFVILWILLLKILHSGECAQLCVIQTHWDRHSAVSSVWDTSAHLVFCQLGTTVCLLTRRRWDAVCWLVFVLLCIEIMCPMIYRLLVQTAEGNLLKGCLFVRHPLRVFKINTALFSRSVHHFIDVMCFVGSVHKVKIHKGSQCKCPDHCAHLATLYRPFSIKANK